MNTETVYEEKYKGLTIKIYPDDSANSPDEGGGDDGLFLVHFHRDCQIEREKIITEDDLRRWYQGEEIDQEKQYHIFAVEAYIHSGVVLALANDQRYFPDRQWDVSHVGAVLASKNEWSMRKAAKNAARGLIETWNAYLSGDVYGYVIENGEGENLGSCWGFYPELGRPNEVYCLDEARAAVGAIVAEKQREHAKKVKAYIKQGVPIEYRKALKV